MKKIKLALIPYSVYALIFIVAPILLILLYSFQDTGGAWTLENYARFFDFSDPVYLKVLWRSIKLAVISTVICLILGYPMAYILSKLSPRVRGTIAFLFVLPMWMNFLLRTYSWMSLLERTGLINTFIEWLNGLLPAAIQIPALNIMYTQCCLLYTSMASPQPPQPKTDSFMSRSPFRSSFWRRWATRSPSSVA